jgi:glutamate synthase (ferredoxin)
MRVSNVCLFGLMAPVVAYAFVPQSLKSPTKVSLRNPQRINNEVGVPTPWSNDQCSFTQLDMAFDQSEPSNIFDGPLALTRERDACGVGFIANTKSGGTIFIC